MSTKESEMSKQGNKFNEERLREQIERNKRLEEKEKKEKGKEFILDVSRNPFTNEPSKKGGSKKRRQTKRRQRRRQTKRTK
jgi:hypothetical protein